MSRKNRTSADALVSRACVICGTRDSSYVFTKGGFELVRCRTCDLAYVANPPTPEALRRLYAFEHGYHQKFGDTSTDVGFETEVARNHLVDLERYKTAGRLLDIGCSAGFFLAEARVAGWDGSGLELLEDTAQIARQKFGLEVTTGVLRDGLFRAGSFDAVTMWDVIEHVVDPVSTLVEVSRILKDDGVLLMETPSIDGLFPRLSYRLAETLSFWPHPEPPYHRNSPGRPSAGSCRPRGCRRSVSASDGFRCRTHSARLARSFVRQSSLPTRLPSLHSPPSARR